MNIYQPYEVLADTKDCLHLKETEARERIQFVRFRILPLLLLFFTYFAVQQMGKQIPMAWNFLFIGIAVVIAASFFFRSYITEIKITADQVFLVQKTINGSREITIPLGEVEKIILKKKIGKSMFTFFILHTKKGKSYLILSIPGIYTDDHHIQLVGERIQEMLKTEIVG